MRAWWLIGWVMLAGCGPTIIEKRVIEAPPPELLRPKPSPEEAAGSVPPLVDVLPAVPLVPAGFVAPLAPDDPRPVVLLEAAEAPGAAPAEAPVEAPAVAPVEGEGAAEEGEGAAAEAGDG